MLVASLCALSPRFLDLGPLWLFQAREGGPDPGLGSLPTVAYLTNFSFHVHMSRAMSPKMSRDICPPTGIFTEPSQTQPMKTPSEKDFMPRNHRPARVRPTTIAARLRCKELRRTIRNPRTARAERENAVVELDKLALVVETLPQIERRIHYLRRRLIAGGLTPGRRAGLEAELRMREANTSARVPESAQ